MTNVHAGVKDFSCEKCSETFLISYDLKKHRAEGHRGQFGSLAERRLENLDLPQIAANWREIGFEDASLNKVHQIRSNSAIWKYFLVNDVTGQAVCKTCQALKDMTKKNVDYGISHSMNSHITGKGIAVPCPYSDWVEPEPMPGTDRDTKIRSESEWARLGYKDVSERKAKELKTKSIVWPCFWVNLKNGRAVCKACQKRFKLFWSCKWDNS